MNARTELIEEVKKANSSIKCALLEVCYGIGFMKNGNCYYFNEDEKKYFLKCGYSNEDLQKFYSEIDFEYDAGYGSQELEGTVWFNDGTWLERVEYDGSERWKHKKLPEIPTELTK